VPNYIKEGILCRLSSASIVAPESYFNISGVAHSPPPFFQVLMHFFRPISGDFFRFQLGA